MRHTRLMLQAAENVVLPNAGEQFVLTCRTDQEALRTQLENGYRQQFPRPATAKG